MREREREIIIIITIKIQSDRLFCGHQFSLKLSL